MWIKIDTYRKILIECLLSGHGQIIAEINGCLIVFGLQVNGWGAWGLYREFTKSLIFNDFDYALKNPFIYVHLFLLHTLS